MGTSEFYLLFSSEFGCGESMEGSSWHVVYQELS